MKNFKDSIKKIFGNKKVTSILKLFVFILIALIFGYFIFTGKQV